MLAARSAGTQFVTNAQNGSRSAHSQAAVPSFDQSREPEAASLCQNFTSINGSLSNKDHLCSINTAIPVKVPLLSTNRTTSYYLISSVLTLNSPLRCFNFVLDVLFQVLSNCTITWGSTIACPDTIIHVFFDLGLLNQLYKFDLSI